MRSLDRSRGSTDRNALPGSGRQPGTLGSGPASTENSSATSSTVRAIGPAVERSDHGSPAVGTRPGDGRKPTTLQNAAGLRSEPPVSLPSAMGIMRAAKATAAPPLLPPQVLAGSYGFRLAPKTRLKVCEPAPNSGVLVLPTVSAPAVRMRATIRASSAGTWSANRGDP